MGEFFNIPVSYKWKCCKNGIFSTFSVFRSCHFPEISLNPVTMATVTSVNEQTLFFAVLGQRYSTHKVSEKSETMRAGPLCKFFGA